MNILITGGAGHVGTALTASLVDTGHQVTVLDNLSNGKRHFLDARAQFVQGDVRNSQDLDQVFSIHAYDWVIHCAALKSLPESESQPVEYYQNNVSGLIELLGAMKKHGVKRLMFSSTAAVYAPKKTGVFTEQDPIGPQSIYGVTKSISEQIIQHAHRTGLLEQYVIYRYFNLAGDCGIRYYNKSEQNIFSLLQQCLIQDKTFDITGTDFDTHDGTGVRDYIHISDLVDAHTLVLDSASSGIFNLGTGDGYSVRELIKTFELVSGTSLDVNEQERRVGDIGKAIADPHKANNELHWQASRALQDMVASSLEAVAAHMNNP